MSSDPKNSQNGTRTKRGTCTNHSCNCKGGHCTYGKLDYKYLVI